MIQSIVSFYQSSIGKKWIVAITGLGLIAYVFGHLAGNLQFFIGADQINAYAKLLHSTGPMLWVVRAGLLAIFVLHIAVTVQLAAQNRHARPAGYTVKKRIRSSLASRTMILSGLIVLSFVIYHLMHFTVRVVPEDFAYYIDEKGRHDTYRMMVEGFQNPIATAFYVLGVGLLCLHLSHGFASVLQTFGMTSRAVLGWLSGGARMLAVLIFAGYISIPGAVLFGVGADYVETAKTDPTRIVTDGAVGH